VVTGGGEITLVGTIDVGNTVTIVDGIVVV
jgi:hypothetical protein